MGTSASIKLTMSPRWGVELIKVVCVRFQQGLFRLLLASHQKRSIKLMWVGAWAAVIVCHYLFVSKKSLVPATKRMKNETQSLLGNEKAVFHC